MVCGGFTFKRILSRLSLLLILLQVCPAIVNAQSSGTLEPQENDTKQGQAPSEGSSEDSERSPSALNSERERAKQEFLSTRELSRELNSKGDYQDSLSLWNGLIATLDSKPMLRCRACVHRGYVLARLGQYDSALENFNYFIENAPRQTSAIAAYCFFWRGRTLVKLGRIEEAATSYSMAEARNSDPELARFILNALANCLTRLGRFEDALSVFEKLDALDIQDGKSETNQKQIGSFANPQVTLDAKKNVSAPELKIRQLAMPTPTASEHRQSRPLHKPSQSAKGARIASPQGARSVDRLPSRAASLTNSKRKSGLDDDLLADIILADKTKEVDDYSGLLCSGSGDAESYYGRGIALLCLGRYRQAALDFKNFVDRADWSGQAPYHAVIFCRLSDVLSGHPQTSTSLLAKAAAKMNKDNQLQATLRYLIDPTTEKDLLKAAGSDSAKTRAHCVLGVVAMAQGRRDVSKRHLDWVREHGDKRMDEYLVAVSILKRHGQPI